MFFAQNKRKTLSWKPSQIFLWLESDFRWPTFLMANKYRKVWKVVSHKPVSRKETQPLSSNLIFHTRTKYIEVDYHFVCDRIAKKDIQIHFISSNDQLVDVLLLSHCLIFSLFIYGPSFIWIFHLQLEGVYYRMYYIIGDNVCSYLV